MVDYGGRSWEEGALARARQAWDGPAAGFVKWSYSAARQAYEREVADGLASLLEVPSVRVVPQGSRIDAQAGVATATVWLLDLQSDPSSTQRPARDVQLYLHEWLALCERREGGAEVSPAPPPPPPSTPPKPPPPDERHSPPPPPGYWNPFLTQPLSDEGAAGLGDAAAARTRPRGGRGGPEGPGATAAAAAAAEEPTPSVSGEPAGRRPWEWQCPLVVRGALLVAVSDTTPPSPPDSPPPPPPPSPPSPPPSPPYVECAFIPCEAISDEEVERLDRLRHARGAADNDADVLAAAAEEAAAAADEQATDSRIAASGRRRILGDEPGAAPEAATATAAGEPSRSLLGIAVLDAAPLTAIACAVWGCH